VPEGRVGSRQLLASREQAQAEPKQGWQSAGNPNARSGTAFIQDQPNAAGRVVISRWNLMRLVSEYGAHYTTCDRHPRRLAAAAFGRAGSVGMSEFLLTSTDTIALALARTPSAAETAVRA